MNDLAYKKMVSVISKLGIPVVQPSQASSPLTIAPPKSIHPKKRSFIEKLLPSRQVKVPERPDSGNQRLLFSVLDVGTAYAKALIVERQSDGTGIVLGAGRNQRNYTHMSDG